MVIPKLRDAARGQVCTLRLNVCNHDTGTTVLAHAPSNVSGMGNKSHDFWGAHACSACHDAIDHHNLAPDEEAAVWFRAIPATMENLIARGMMVLPPEKQNRPAPEKRCAAPRKLKSSIQSAGFQKGHRPMQSRNTFGTKK
ncbi:nuclease domain-containing protein [Ahrensia sp. R2A130]|uniref:nuclease domain-containing protein n=1 Tax=Ahrensia sp. R2A130 TaxID=744979 RepID=UPI00031CDB83|nr:nuclease domain-containing protein [Ahrensia sp. R2A130]